MITLWGPTSAGKTALLSYLYLRSQASESDWEIFLTQSSSQMAIEQSMLISRDNTFPAGTQPDSDGERTVSYNFRNKKTEEVFPLETKDRAGVRYTSMDPEVLESLSGADGVVLLLDYGRGLRETEVINALSLMNVNRSGGAPKKDDRPLAVCLSKVDQLLKTPEQYKTLQEDPARFVRDHLSDELRRWIDVFHTNVRYFPVSAVGIRLNFGYLQKSVFLDERLTLRVTTRGTPINILEPFVWIFESLRGVV